MRQPRLRLALSEHPALSGRGLPAFAVGSAFALTCLVATGCGADADGDGQPDPQVTVQPADSEGGPTASPSPTTSNTMGAAPAPQSPTAQPGGIPGNNVSPTPDDTTDEDTNTPATPGGSADDPGEPGSGTPMIPTSDEGVRPPFMPAPVTPPSDPTDPRPNPNPTMPEPMPDPMLPEADAGAPGEPDVDGGSAPSGDEVPMTDHCAAVADWDPMWTQWEDEVLLLVNEYRSMGFNCDSQGSFGATTPLSTDPILRCAARLHSLDMYERGYFDHDNPDGIDPFERMAAAGFMGSYMGENIAQGQTSPEDVMRAWMDSDGHCSNVMNPNYTLLGVGYHPGSDSNRRAQRYWTQNFGAPRQQGGGRR